MQSIDLWEPDYEKWNGLARDIVMWMQMSSDKPWKGSDLYTHLRRLGRRIPNWLKKEIPDTEHCSPKGSIAVAIYRAMLIGDQEHSSCPGYEEATQN